MVVLCHRSSRWLSFTLILNVSVLLTLASPISGMEGAPQHVRVQDGFLIHPDGSKSFVGFFTSALQAQVIAPLFPAVNTTEESRVSLLNSSTLRTLDLVGNYLSDVPVRPPSFFVLRLDGSLTLAGNATCPDRYPAMVSIVDVLFSSIVGGLYDATRNSSYMAVRVQGGRAASVKNITAKGACPIAIISVTKGSMHEIAGSELDGGGQAGRCLWTLSTQRALVHDNHVHNCTGHALDFDAYTSRSAAWGNLCEDCGFQGIFVEETASDNFLFANTCRNNKGEGIAVYSNAVGPVARNLFVNNIVTGNSIGISSGGYGHDPRKHAEDNIYIGNVALGNNVAGFNVAHGAVEGETWLDNTNDDGWSNVPSNSSAVTIIDL
eukprot:TRINITY_DN43697_c0_g1_i1.p1 TRINITY_DN43697_c0_g1~~TRINITY_DN43697_c0_g1_i1.p1  ORF type:complete len:378 (+),score=40.71 TRINITY_DN43697_c0_g1_i1:62-1195(+)